MKKFLKFLLLGISLLTLTACGKSQEAVMYIEEAQLTEEEKNILKLANCNENLLIYDANLDSKAQSYRVTTYELKDGKWEMIASSAGAIRDSKIRISLKFDKISDGINMGMVSENSSGNTSYIPEEKLETEGMGVVTSSLHQLSEISYGEEISLVGQVISKKDTIEFNLDDYNKPEEIERKDYEHVYYIVIEFSNENDLLE